MDKIPVTEPVAPFNVYADDVVDLPSGTLLQSELGGVFLHIGDHLQELTEQTGLCLRYRILCKPAKDAPQPLRPDNPHEPYYCSGEANAWFVTSDSVVFQTNDENEARLVTKLLNKAHKKGCDSANS